MPFRSSRTAGPARSVSQPQGHTHNCLSDHRLRTAGPARPASQPQGHAHNCLSDHRVLQGQPVLLRSRKDLLTTAFQIVAYCRASPFCFTAARTCSQLPFRSSRTAGPARSASQPQGRPHNCLSDRRALQDQPVLLHSRKDMLATAFQIYKRVCGTSVAT